MFKRFMSFVFILTTILVLSETAFAFKSPEMVLVEPGSTTIRSREIIVENNYLIGKYEVTQAEFEAVMGFNPSHFTAKNIENLKADCENRPVESVNWYEAVMFCNKLSEAKGLEKYYEITDIKNGGNGAEQRISAAKVSFNKGAKGYRLPTRDEFWYAACGGKDGKLTKYAGSNHLDEVGWYADNSGLKKMDRRAPPKEIGANRVTHPVGLKKPNELGIYDMTGNAREWVNDRIGFEKVNRASLGGSFGERARKNLLFEGAAHDPDLVFFLIGFRLCRTPESINETEWIYSYSSPKHPKAREHIVKSENVEVVFENPVYYWKPKNGGKKKGDNPGIIIYRFKWEENAVGARLYLYMPTFHWSYSKGYNSLYGSKDGRTWMELMDVKPPNFGKASSGVYDNKLPDHLLGGKELWLKVELDSYGPKAEHGSAMSNTAQLSRYNVKAKKETFRLEVQLENNEVAQEKKAAPKGIVLD